ncbi:scopoletin glucosyltransferase [Cryptomeria japonica]|uniref:scopoletin glucosyltransferase n=1 Tax=Cryptomeria japonica TaxID=3369 RepID=UPI0027DA85BC|nr:scopoletin glucosyltransferase [Cryptomeria japonica]
MNELALGLESSMKPFLWVLQPPTDVGSCALNDFLPQGFRARAERRGRIVMGWTDQLAVLSHAAIGAFLTHRGWNSLLEGIFSGVPFICWPITVDQSFNTKFIEEEAKCGLRIWKGANKDEIGRVITNVFDEEDEAGKVVRRNTIKWKKLAEGAVCEGGSSAKNFDSLVDDILSLQHLKDKPIVLGQGSPT